MLRALFAAILIALTVTPFTAPFSTCDLATVDPLHQADSISAAKMVEDTSALPFCAASATPAEHAEQFRPAVPSFAIAINEGRSLVLRL